ncbi:YcaO-like family protein [Maridesulfovibrio sp.]|uniref:YcaO-like family protein n=1 Tax=Maridesulfovibrio sp. TaxID=2795000 RepID=UPI0029CA020B|nr:YcaO-like family protein [Maridesulfovibrio sp.]
MATPSETITRAKQLLKKMGIQPLSEKWFNFKDQVHSVRIETDFNNGFFGTNGKGVTKDYALASAYAEFLERLQNGMLPQKAFTRSHLSMINAEVGFNYFPDEKTIELKQFLQLPETVLSDAFGDGNCLPLAEKYFKRTSASGSNGVVALPFYDILNNETILLPLNLILGLTGSNGMCAGNSDAEAIYQGLCEIIERFCSAHIFFNELTPPDVPDSYLRQFPEEYAIIQSITRDGRWAVVVKSFATEHSFPVLGLILIDNDSKKYRLNVGCDTSFKTALQRCLTELFQGMDDNLLSRLMIPMPNSFQNNTNSSSSTSIAQKRQEFINFTVNGSGAFPKSLFGSENSYYFTPSVFKTQDSFESEVSKIINKVKSLGFSVYIRNTSFTKFPSFWIYIPEMSILGNDNNIEPINNIDYLVEIDSVEDFIFSLKSVTKNEMHNFATILSKLDTSSTIQNITKIEVLPSSNWSQLPTKYLHALISKYLGKEDDSINLLNELICSDRKQDVKNFPFDMLYCKQGDIKTIADNIRLPHCPNCHICPLNNECTTKGKISLYTKMWKSAAWSQPSQNIKWLT